jgi:hypothetical protein
MPFFLEPSRLGIDSLIYIGLWPSIWIVCFWWVRECMVLNRIGFAEISEAAAIGSMLLAVSVLCEFALVNTTGLYLSDVIHFPIDDFPQVKVIGEEFNRPRGFTAEAGFSAILFECLPPLSIAWLWRGYLRSSPFTALVLPAYLLLFSSASFLLVGVALMVLSGLGRGWLRSIVIGIIIAVLGSTVSQTLPSISWLIYEVIGRKLLEFNTENVIGEMLTFARPEACNSAWTTITEQPWGIGWGGLSQEMADSLVLFGVEMRGSGLISIPLEIGASTGVLGMAIYLVIVWRKLARLVRIDSLNAWLTSISLMWVALHHTVVLEFWFPMIWLSLALANVVALRAAAQRIASSRSRTTVTPQCATLARGTA